MLSSNVLVLNKSYLPVHITSVKRALCLLYRGLAKVVDKQYELFDFKSWSHLSSQIEGEKIGLVHGGLIVPRVILLHFYDRLPRRQVRFSRLNVYLRDDHTCQYCGKKRKRAELNLDHIIPISLGGKTEWENVVCSCVECNITKGGRLPEQAGMSLFKKPAKPDWSHFFRLMTKPTYHIEWKPFLNMVDFSYWNVELKD